MPAEPNTPADGNLQSAAAARSLRKKQILVVVLVVGLVVALLTQPESEEAIVPEVMPTVTSTSLASTPPATVESDQGQSTETAAENLAQVRSLSRVDLATILQWELLTPEADAPQQELVTQVPEVQAVYGTSTGGAALMGRTIVRGGQDLPGGVTVLGVTEDGIRVGRD